MRRTPFPARPFRAALALATILLPALAVASTGSGEIEVRRDGSSWARIEDGGAVRIDGRVAGAIEKDGGVRLDGRVVGRVETDGEIREGGRNVGTVEKDGTIREGGRAIGRIEKGGAVRRDGVVWGYASPCCSAFDDARRVAALLYFFDSAFFER